MPSIRVTWCSVHDSKVVSKDDGDRMCLCEATARSAEAQVNFSSTDRKLATITAKTCDAVSATVTW